MEKARIYYELPAEDLEMIKESACRIRDIEDMLAKMGNVKTPKYYTVKEFLQQAKISRQKYEEIKHLLNPIRPSQRKTLIPHSDLIRWLNGEISI